MDGRVGERASYSVNIYIYIYIIYLRNPVRTSSKLQKKKNMQPEPTEITNIAYVPGTFIPNCRTEI